MVAESIKSTDRKSTKKVPAVIPNNADNIKPQPVKGKSSSVSASGPVSNKSRPKLLAKKNSTTSVSDSKSKLSDSIARKQNQSLDIRTAKQVHQKTSNEPGAKLDTAGQQEFVVAKGKNLNYE